MTCPQPHWQRCCPWFSWSHLSETGGNDSKERQDRSARRRPLTPGASGSHRSDTGVKDSRRCGHNFAFVGLCTWSRRFLMTGGNREVVATSTVPEAFRDAETCAAIKAHDLTHWTKHPSRLDRDFGGKLCGDMGYAREELVAELGRRFSVRGSRHHARAARGSRFLPGALARATAG